MTQKAERGTKRTCQSCNARFYDLNREEIVCPMCGAVFELETPAEPEEVATATAETPSKPVVKPVPASGSDDDVEAEDDLVELDDDDAKVATDDDDDAFLPDDEEEGTRMSAASLVVHVTALPCFRPARTSSAFEAVRVAITT